METRVLIQAIKLQNEKHSVVIENERSRIYHLPMAQQVLGYDKMYTLGESDRVTNAYSITYGEDEGINRCLVFASGSQTSLDSRSGILRDNQCIFAIGCFLAALRLPDLTLAWHTKVDTASCFGVYHIPQYEGYVSHGELSIALVDYDGRIRWSQGGKDIFTNGFTLYDKTVEVIDFLNNEYRFDLQTGNVTLRSGAPDAPKL